MIQESTGALTLTVDKWNVSEAEKGDKLVEYAGRGLSIPDDPTEPPASGSYVGTYTYKPDGSWTGEGTGTETFEGGDTTNYTWKEDSRRNENTYTYTGGTGKYKGVSGDGTYTLYKGVSRGGTYTYRPGPLQSCQYTDKINMP